MDRLHHRFTGGLVWIKGADRCLQKLTLPQEQISILLSVIGFQPLFVSHQSTSLQAVVFVTTYARQLVWAPWIASGLQLVFQKLLTAELPAISHLLLKAVGLM